MSQTIGVTEARTKFAELVDSVRYRGDTVVLMKSGKPAAAMVPFEWLDRYRQDRELAFRVVDEVRSHNQAASMDEKGLASLIAEAVSAVRAEAR